MRILLVFFFFVISQAIVIGQVRYLEQGDTVGIENKHCRITFDRETGSLQSITNLLLGDEYLKEANETKGMPFRIYKDFTKDFELSDEASAISRTIVRPLDCRLVDVQKDEGLILCYKCEKQGLEINLHVKLEEGSGVSDWSLRVTNTAQKMQEMMISFPCLVGVALGPDPNTNLATGQKLGSTITPAWAFDGGIHGRGHQLIMQWHAIWDPVSRSALGLIFMDPDAQTKKLLLREKDIETLYFPPVKIPHNASLEVPSARLLVYKGTWRPAARAYRRWFEQAIPCVEPPEWFRKSDMCEGRHFKKDGPGIKAGGGQFVLESFRDLPKAHLRIPFDNLEYAFYSRGSMLHGVHTDGDNIIREDMGGAEAMRDGIAKVHRLGLHATLYVEGYIVHNKSELAKSGKAERWSIMHKDGSIEDHYTNQGFYHMCPGCEEWQDYLAEMVARLLRETNADGVRLDSLGFAYRPCYNPAHRHATPFGCNEWMKQLLAKVREAAIEVNPNVLLTTEAGIDWYGQWFNGALTQVYPRDIPPMRLAVRPYRTYVYARGGPVWSSLSGFAGGRTCWKQDMEKLEENWLCARFPVHEALVWGDVADEDPRSSDPEIDTRCFEREGYWAVVAARPDCQGQLDWPQYTGLSGKRRKYTLTLPGLGTLVSSALLCDIETLTWTPLELHRQGKDISLNLSTNWALVILTRDDGPAIVGFNALPTLHAGESTVVQMNLLSDREMQSSKIRVVVSAPGLSVTPREIDVPSEVKITVPPNALPGFYGVKVTGENLLGIKRFLEVVCLGGKPTMLMPYVSSDKYFVYSTDIALACDTEGIDIRYTTDGSEPTLESRLYTLPFTINKTTTIKMRTFKKNTVQSFVIAEKIKKLNYQGAVELKGLKSGLLYDYYEGLFLSVLDMAAKFEPIKSGVKSNFNLDLPKKEVEYFGFEYNGYIYIAKDGIYTFYVKSNDGSKLYLDGKEVIDNDGDHTAIEKSNTVALRAGKHAIAVKYYQAGARKYLKVSWQGSGFGKQEVPAEILFHRKNGK